MDKFISMTSDGLVGLLRKFWRFIVYWIFKNTIRSFYRQGEQMSSGHAFKSILKQIY